MLNACQVCFHLLINTQHNKTTYAYDLGGNLLSQTEYAYMEGNVGTPTRIIPYVYGDTNWKDKLTSFDGKAITYDAIRNPLTYDGSTMTWVKGRRLALYTKTGLAVSYIYNENGIRTSKTVNGIMECHDNIRDPKWVYHMHTPG